MVDQIILIARSVGVPVINGERYFSLLTQDHDHCHSTKSDENDARCIMSFEVMINAAYAIVPRASDAALLRRPEHLPTRALGAAGTSPTGSPAKAGAPPGPPAQKWGPRGPPLTDEEIATGTSAPTAVMSRPKPPPPVLASQPTTATASDDPMESVSDGGPPAGPPTGLSPTPTPPTTQWGRLRKRGLQKVHQRASQLPSFRSFPETKHQSYDDPKGAWLLPSMTWK